MASEFAMASMRRTTSEPRRSNSRWNCDTRLAVRWASRLSKDLVTVVETTPATIQTASTTVAVMLRNTLERKLMSATSWVYPNILQMQHEGILLLCCVPTMHAWADAVDRGQV